MHERTSIILLVRSNAKVNLLRHWPFYDRKHVRERSVATCKVRLATPSGGEPIGLPRARKPGAPSSLGKLLHQVVAI